MTQEAPTLYPEPIEAHAPPGRGKHGYYRRIEDGSPASGWIVVASTTPSNRSDYEYKGFTRLSKYGEFSNGSAQPRAKARERDARGNPWNPALEPWRLIFQLSGAKEFPIEQIIAYRWHIRPPYKEVSFPQLKGIEITNYGCPECEKGIFSSTNPKAAAAMLRTHLTSAIDAAHKYSPSDLSALGKEWDIDFDSARMGRRTVTFQEPEEPEGAEPPVLTRAKEYKCGACGFEPVPGNKRPWLALTNHKCLAPAGAVPKGVDDAIS